MSAGVASRVSLSISIYSIIINISGLELEPRPLDPRGDDVTAPPCAHVSRRTPGDSTVVYSSTIYNI